MEDDDDVSNIINPASVMDTKAMPFSRNFIQEAIATPIQFIVKFCV